MSTYTFWNLIDEVLSQSQEPLSEREIWDKAVELGLDVKLGSTGKTPWKSISARIYVDIRDNKDSKYIKVGKRPRKFFLKNKAINTPSSNASNTTTTRDQNSTSKKSFNERDIHPLLVKFINEDQHFKSYAKTIYHETSIRRQKGMNEWLHPDIVGVYFPFEDFEKLTLDAQNYLSVNSLKLFSFELKVELDFTNLRQYYFQAVSNSSWANEGYLVCLEIKDDAELINELQRLNSAFGIGVIKLNPEDISQSEIILPSRERTEIDWTTVDRLISDNEDFEEFIRDITEDLKIGKVKSGYDKVYDDGKMEKYLKDKGIVRD